jgi:peptidoglycan-N-acetylglucosamine deacetylase
MKILNSFFKPFPSFNRLAFIFYLYFFLLRLWEFLIVPESNSVVEASMGFAFDILIINAVLLVIYIPFRGIWSINSKLANVLLISASLIFYLLGSVIQLHYTQNNEILNLNNFNCSLANAILYIIDNVSYITLIFAAAFVITMVTIFYILSFRKTEAIHWSWIHRFMLIFLIISLPAALELSQNPEIITKTNQRINKPFAFIKTKVDCIFGKNESTQQDQLTYNPVTKKTYINPDEFPLLHKNDTEDCLASYFKKSNQTDLPDIVLLLVGGLGNDYIFPMNDIQFMPFLEQVRDKSLYWSHFLTPVQEGISPLPSLLGGLPLGDKGFPELENMPYHFSLLNILKENGYQTSYYYGQWAWLQSKSKYLHQNLIDFVWDASEFDENTEKVIIENGTYHWGYNDRDLIYNYFAESIKRDRKPHFDIVHTSSARAPFAITDTSYYQNKFEKLISGVTDQSIKNYLHELRGYFKSLMFNNDALELFFKEYQKKSNYNNTIFIIAGSDPIREFARPHPLQKYHVPLMIYSPLLRDSHVFNNTSSYNDFYGSMLNFLSERYDLNVPEISTSIGKSLCIQSNTDSPTIIPFFSPTTGLSEILYNDYFLSDDKKLYQVESGFEINIIEDEALQTKITGLLESFKKVNQSASYQLLPDSLYFDFLNFNVLMDTLVYNKKVRGEYFRIINEEPITKNPHTIDITFYNSVVPLNEVFVVYEIMNDKGQIISWKNYGIPPGENDFNFSIHIDETEETDSQRYVQLYIWNESPLPFSFEKLRIVLYHPIDSTNTTPQ